MDLDELVEHWTLLDDERELVAGKRGPTRLGFALLLKFYARAGRFPRGRGELDDEAVAFVARQVGVPASDFGFYEWAGSTIEYHRSQVRRHLGFRECSAEDAGKLTGWLAANVCQAERRADRVREELLARCRAERIEPPSAGRCDRIIRSALHQAEQALIQRVAARLGPDASARLAELAAAVGDDEAEDAEPSALALIKSVPGNVSLESMLTEIGKLDAVRAAGLPDGVFSGIAPKVIAAWRARATVEAPSHLRSHPPALRLTLLAALVHERQREITDTLADLLISTVHRIGARAERRVAQELVSEFRKVAGKETLLFRVAEAAIARPDDTVRAVVYPVAGEKTLRDLVAEYKSSGPAYRRTVQTTLRASYTGHYRRGLIRLLEVLEFRTGSSACQPVIEALALIRRYAAAGSLQYYPAGEHVPAHAGIAEDWKPLVYRTGQHGRRGSCGWSTRSSPSRRCASTCAAKRSGSPAPTGGATPTTTCPPTSRPAATSTTPACASRWTRTPSSPDCARRCAPNWTPCTTRCPAWTGCRSPSGARAPSSSRRWTRPPSHATCGN